MLLNNAVSVAVGLVPIAGDIVLAVYKANSRNAALLEEYLRVRGEEFIKMENKKKADGGKNGEVKKIEGKNGTSDVDQNTIAYFNILFLINLGDKPAPKSDIDQVKPGAGKQTEQGAGSVDVKEGTMLGDLPETPIKKGNSVLRWRPSKATKSKVQDDSKEKLWASPATEETRGDRSKFIEDVSHSSSGSEDQSKNGTLKKRSK
jgi:hypothetical protein